MMTCTSRRTAGYLAVIALSLGGCAALTLTSEPWKPAPVGASWSSIQRNTGSFGKDTQTTTTRLADRVWQGNPALALKVAAGTLLQQPGSGRWLAFLGPEDKLITSFDPPAGWESPIAVGGSWKRVQKMTNHVSGRTLEYEWACTVPAYEKVSVPAGSFDAFRVECTSTAGSQDTYWVSPAVHPFLKTRSVRSASHPAGAGTQEIELLRVPS